MSIPRWLKNENVTGLPDPDKEQSTEMKSVVSAANDAWRAVSKTQRLRVTLSETRNKLA